MWKCFNRGVWETIDRCVNVFKVETANGTCLIPSLAKELEDISTKEVNKNELSTRSEDRFETCSIVRGGSPPREHLLRGQVVNKSTVKIHCSPTSSRIFSTHSGDLVRLNSGSDLHSSRKEADIKCHDECHRSSGTVDPCRVTGKGESECFRGKREVQHADCVSGVLSADRDRLRCSDESNNSLRKWRLGFQSPNGTAKDTHSPEKSNRIGLSETKLNEICLTGNDNASSHTGFSFLPVDNGITGKNVVHPEMGDMCMPPQVLFHPNVRGKLINCVLKLPFHGNNFARFKGLNITSVSCLTEFRNEFEKDRGRRPGEEQGGESEEAKEDAWRRHYQMHSLVEAIGWSSAVLFGWFLGQFRFWHIRGERNCDNKSESKRKCCFIGSLAKFFISWRREAALPLRILPSEVNGIAGACKERKDLKVPVDETTFANDQCNTFLLNSVPVLGTQGSNQCDGILSRGSLICQGTEAPPPPPESNTTSKCCPTTWLQKNAAIPMPWHADSSEGRTFGPITLEEAMKGAERELEAAQAEVLLMLALEKLDADNCSAYCGPLPADLFRSAATLGSSAAAFNLGVCYEKGMGGVVINLVQAFHWYQQASDKGHAAATYNLAIFHANGLAGLHPNTHLANQLLVKAADLELPQAHDALAVLSSHVSSGRVCHNTDASPFQISHAESDSFVSQCSLKQPSIFESSYNEAKSLISVGMKAAPFLSEYALESSKTPALKLNHLTESHHPPSSNSFHSNEELMAEIKRESNRCLKKNDLCNSAMQIAAQ